MREPRGPDLSEDPVSEKSPEAGFYEDPAPHPVMEAAAIKAAYSGKVAIQSMLFIIEGALRSKKNSKRILRHGRVGRMFIASSAPYMKWEKQAIMQVRAQRAGTPTIPLSVKVRVASVVYIAKGRPMDRDNARGGIFDVLEAAGVIANDSQIWDDPLRFAYDRERPRVEVRVQPIVVEET